MNSWPDPVFDSRITRLSISSFHTRPRSSRFEMAGAGVPIFSVISADSFLSSILWSPPSGYLCGFFFFLS